MTRACKWLAAVATWAALLVPVSFAQSSIGSSSLASSTEGMPSYAVPNSAVTSIATPAPALPQMSPDLALEAYLRQLQEQGTRLYAYSDNTLMLADLPDTRQKGDYELKRLYVAPDKLLFTPIKFEGDGFVKSNVLIRLLQSEVEHVNKQEGKTTAISPANYKFSHKSTEVLNGRSAYVYNVKPRKKRVGLFKGRIYIDPYTGRLLRAEGDMVKSPSIFIRSLNFVQDYTDISGFTLPTHIHSTAKVRIIGRTIVDIFHRDYKARAVEVNTASAPSANSESASLE